MQLVITGPRSVGKSTASVLVSERMGLPYLSSDQLLDARLAPHGGLVAVMASNDRSPVIDEGIKLVEEVMSRSGDFVFDLAGGAIGSPETRDPVLKSLRGATICGLLPLEEDEASVRFLMTREEQRPHFLGTEATTLHQLVSRDYLRLKPALVERADHIVIVGNRSPQQIAAEIALAFTGN